MKRRKSSNFDWSGNLPIILTVGGVVTAVGAGVWIYSDLKDKAAELGQTVINAYGELKNGGESLGSLAQAAIGEISDVLAPVGEAAGEALSTAKDVVSKASNVVSDIVDPAASIASTALTGAADVVKTADMGARTVLKTAKDVAQDTMKIARDQVNYDAGELKKRGLTQPQANALAVAYNVPVPTFVWPLTQFSYNYVKAWQYYFG